MKTLYFIYELEEVPIETFAGYSDGYGKEYKYTYTLVIPDWAKNYGYDSKEEALRALNINCVRANKYEIKKVYMEDDSNG